jgi:hypothetical protein
VELGDFVPSTSNFEVDHVINKTGTGRLKSSLAERKLFPKELYDYTPKIRSQ